MNLAIPVTVKILIALVCLVVVLLLVILNLPIRLVADEAFESMNITDLDGANLLSGDLWVNRDNLGLVRLEYDWCPGLSPAKWCMQIEHPLFSMNGNLQIVGAGIIKISDLVIDSLEMDALGIPGGLVNSRFSGVIEEMELELSNCPLKDMKNLSGNLGTADVQVFGVSAGSHALSLTTESEKVLLGLSGETFSGDVEISEGNYLASGEVNASEEMVPMVRNLMRPLGDNRFGWEISGSLPC